MQRPAYRRNDDRQPRYDGSGTQPDKENARDHKFERQKHQPENDPRPSAILGNEIDDRHDSPQLSLRVEGGRAPLERLGVSPPNDSRAISAIPPNAPMTLAASTGSIKTFWLGAEATASSALI